jgi:hypothetical protein
MVPGVDEQLHRHGSGWQYRLRVVMLTASGEAVSKT